MRTQINIPVEKIVPSPDDVLRAQGIPDPASVKPRTTELARQALSVFMVMAQPNTLVMEITPEDFETVYEGHGENAEPTPLTAITPRADNLALFAVTIGDTICQEIARQFEVSDYAQAAMLDAAASEGTERLANELEQCYRDYLRNDNRFESSCTTMPFSPGYCGWHISAQRKLFDTLQPEEIAVYLNDSFLMQPLKSISGVIIAGPKEIFEFDDDFEFCRDCRTRSCRDRIEALKRM